MLLQTAKMSNTRSNFFIILVVIFAELTFVSDESKYETFWLWFKMCSVNYFILPSVKVLGDKYGNAVS